MKKKDAILVTIDGSKGEGGGQMLRSSLSLSMLTGTPFKMVNIRKNRSKSGLMRQHLTCIQAAREISGAKVTGAELGSSEITFIPKAIRGGEYHFSVPTAGSAVLVAQTVLPALLKADVPSKVTIQGGTHLETAPSFEFFRDSFLPILKKMGVQAETRIKRHGFYPVGGGEISFTVNPCPELTPLSLIRRDNLTEVRAEVWLSDVDVNIARRELDTIQQEMNWPTECLHIRQIPKAVSSGNVIVLKMTHGDITETITKLGKFGVPAEMIARKACEDARNYLNSECAVGEHLSDQLLLPMIMAGAGEIMTLSATPHTISNIYVIEQFIDCKFILDQLLPSLWVIRVQG